jgi:hypothetical protein
MAVFDWAARRVFPPRQHRAGKELTFGVGSQVWFPDSAFKTAQAIRDFNGEQLPLIVFANWRGFSGGMRDMFEEVWRVLRCNTPAGKNMHNHSMGFGGHSGIICSWATRGISLPGK